jgi:hypothetical protein
MSEIKKTMRDCPYPTELFTEGQMESFLGHPVDDIDPTKSYNLSGVHLWQFLDGYRALLAKEQPEAQGDVDINPALPSILLTLKKAKHVLTSHHEWHKDFGKFQGYETSKLGNDSEHVLMCIEALSNALSTLPKQQPCALREAAEMLIKEHDDFGEIAPETLQNLWKSLAEQPNTGQPDGLALISQGELYQFELDARRDDLFDIIVPSDVRRMISEIARLRSLERQLRECLPARESGKQDD